MDYEKNYENQATQAIPTLGGLGRMAGMQARGSVNTSPSTQAPPVSPHSLSGALDRLHHAITANGELIGHVGQRLEGIGIMRPDVPQADSRNEKNGLGNDSQLASGLNVLAQMIEGHNARLSNIVNRIDG